MRAYLIVIGLLLAIFGSIAGYLYIRFAALAATDFSPPPVTIAASLSQADSWAQYLDAVGTIKAVRGIELTSESSGEITAINFNSGDRAVAGQLLVVLNDEIEVASRQNEIATLELAEILFERDGKLIKQNSIPQSQYDQSRADLARAKAQLAETEARLKNKRIQAPFDGALGIRQVNLGDYVSPGTVIATLQDASELEIDFTLPARYAPELHKGLLIELQVSAHADRTFNAELVALDSRVDTGTRSLLARAMLKETQGLLPGMFAILRINLDQQVDVITVPQTAVTYSLQGNVVYVVEQREAGGLTAVSRIVTVGEVREGRAAILSGLAAGEEIVTVGQNKLFRNVEILIDKDVRL